MKKRVAEITNVLYGQNSISCEPTKEEIEKAILEKDFERRSFQGDLNELNAEWNKEAKNFYEVVKRFHIRKTACLVVEGWDEPILLCKDERTILDGLHRLKAAIFLKMDTIDVIVTDAPSNLSAVQKDRLWKARADYGNFKEALGRVGIQILKE